MGHSPSRPVRRQDRAALRLVHRRAGGPDCSFRENVIGIQRQCISIGHGGRINLNNQRFKSNRSGSRCRFELVSMLRRVSAGSIKSKLLHNVWNRQFFNPIDLNPLKPNLSRYSQRETLWVEWLPVYIWRTQFLTSSILTTWRCVSVRWPLSSGVIALKLKHIMIIIKASKPKIYTILKYTQNKNQPSIRDIGGIKAHNRQSFLIWKGQKLRLKRSSKQKLCH